MNNNNGHSLVHALDLVGEFLAIATVASTFDHFHYISISFACCFAFLEQDRMLYSQNKHKRGAISCTFIVEGSSLILCPTRSLNKL